MKRLIGAYIVGLTGIVLGFIWLRQQIPKRKTEILPTDNLSPPQQQSQQLLAATPDNKKPKKHGPAMSGNRIVAGTLLVIAIGLFMLWCVNLLGNYFLSFPPPKEFENTVPVPTKLYPITFETVSTSQGSFPRPHATSLLVITQIKSDAGTEATLKGTLDLTVPTSLQAQMCDFSNNALNLQQLYDKLHKTPCGWGTPIAVQTQYQGFQLKPQYMQQSITLHIENDLTYESTTIPIPLKELFPPAINPVSGDAEADIHIPVTLAMISQGQAYPDDWYWSKVGFIITLPNAIDIYPAPGTLESDLPVDMRVVVNAGIQNITVALTQEKGAYPDLHDFHLFATRSLYFLFLVYSTALLIPLAFFIILGHTLFLSKRRMMSRCTVYR